MKITRKQFNKLKTRVADLEIVVKFVFNNRLEDEHNQMKEDIKYLLDKIKNGSEKDNE